ncbi:MAG: ATP-binding cassette domain-containing protein, partial [Candidatus Dormibacteria bacterium]
MSELLEPLARLEVEGLEVAVEGKQILSGVSLTIPKGEVHALMGPNGAGKTSLGYAVMGHPKYQVTSGEIRWKGESLLGMLPEKRARQGLFLSLQYPTAIPGVTSTNFLRAALKGQGKELPAREFLKLIRDEMTALKMD